MVTINGVKAQNLQAKQDVKIKPTMNEILAKMQANFDQFAYNDQNQANYNQSQTNTEKSFQNQANQNNSQNNQSGLDNFGSMLQGENGILFNLLPMLLSKDKSNMGKEIMTRMLANSGNPMLSKLVSMLTKVNKKDFPVQKFEQESNTENTSKIDDFKRVEE